MPIPKVRFQITDNELKIPTFNFYGITENSVLNFAYQDIESIKDNLESLLKQNIIDIIPTAVDEVEKALDDLFDIDYRGITKDFFSSVFNAGNNADIIKSLIEGAFHGQDINPSLLENLAKEVFNGVLPNIDTDGLLDLESQQKLNKFLDVIKIVTKDGYTHNNVNPAAVSAMIEVITKQGYDNSMYGIFKTIDSSMQDKTLLIEVASRIANNKSSDGDIFAIIDIAGSSIAKDILPVSPDIIKNTLKNFRIPNDVNPSSYVNFFTLINTALVQIDPNWSITNNIYEVSEDFKEILNSVVQYNNTDVVSDIAYSYVAQQFN